jgi:hypothetical protein
MRLAVGKIDRDLVISRIYLQCYAALPERFLLHERVVERFNCRVLKAGDLLDPKAGRSRNFPDKSTQKR